MKNSPPGTVRGEACGATGAGNSTLAPTGCVLTRSQNGG